MVKSASFKELQQAINNGLAAETLHIFELTERLGLNPKTDLARADLSGCNLVAMDLREAYFRQTNLQSANLGKPFPAPFTARDLARARDLDLTLDYTLAQDHDRRVIRDLERTLACVHDLDLAIEQDLLRTLERTLDLALDLDRILFQQRWRWRWRSRTLARDVLQSFDHAFGLAHKLHFEATLQHPIASDLHIAHAAARAIVRAIAHTTTRIIDRTHNLSVDLELARIPTLSNSLCLICMNAGADLTGADLTGANLTQTNVEGTIMTGCMGLSPETVAGLKRRGAIFEDLGERTSADTLIPQ